MGVYLDDILLGQGTSSTKKKQNKKPLRMLLKRWLNKMEVFEKLLDAQLYAYFKNASFYENPIFMQHIKWLSFI